MHNYVDLVFNNNYFYGHKLNVVRYEYAYDKKLKSKPFSDKFLYSQVNFRKLNGIKIDNSKDFVSIIFLSIPLVFTRSGLCSFLGISPSFMYF